MSRQLISQRPNSVWDFMSEVDKVFDDLWTTPQNATSLRNTFENAPRFAPPVDINETPDYFLLSLDLPGISQSDVKIEAHDGHLSVSGERNREETKEDGLFKRYERSYGRFQRTFQLPKNVDQSKIQARTENGVLEVMLPKIEAAKPQPIKIEAENKGLFSKLLGRKKTDTESH